MRLYKRDTELHVFTHGPSSETDDTVVYDFTKAEKTIIKDLHMDFSVRLDETKDPNIGVFRIYNLSAANRGKFSQDHQGIEFHAGYDGDRALIFRGYTNNVVHNRQGTDWVTQIFAMDAEKQYLNRTFNKTYPAGTRVDNIVKDVGSSMGLPVSVTGLLETDTITVSETYVGLCKDVLDDIAQDWLLDWSVLFGTIEVKAAGSVFESDPTVTVISKDTGMIESPEVSEWTDPGKKKKKRKNNRKKVNWGIKVRSLLLAGIRPGRAVKVEAQDVLITENLNEVSISNLNMSGIYLAKKVSYTGNNYGGPYEVEIEGELT